MKNRLVASFIVMDTLIFLVVGCGNENEPDQQSEGDLLTGKWILTSFKRNGIEELPDCAKDNTVIFRKDNTYASDPGDNFCSLSDFQDQPQSNGHWELRNNASILVKKSESSEDLVNILDLTSTTLRFSIQYSDYVAEFKFTSLSNFLKLHLFRMGIF